MNASGRDADIPPLPFADTLGVTVAELTAEQATATMAWAEHLCTAGGVLHGGALMAFADTVGALCAVANLPKGASTSTIESKTNFFRAVRGGIVSATCKPLHVGRSTIVVQTELRDGRGKRVAQVTQTQAVLGEKEA
jgi:1,4-dihydroxy-2-naphthoyl-CoA hydrolase